MSSKKALSTPKIEVKPQLERLSRNAKIPVHINETILDKIKFLCREISKVEWSGVLFYSVIGSIKDPKNFRCIIEDILPMDKGTGAYTEYEYDDRVIDFIQADESRFNWRIGHIHSHNTMATYFSGTDMDELNDNCENHNYYLSLIVNNFMDMVAKIAYSASIENYILKAEDEDTKVYQETIQVSKQLMVIYDCDIVKPCEALTVSNEFLDNVKNITSHKENKKFISTTKQLDLFADDWDDFEIDLFDENIDEFTCYLLRLGQMVTGDSIDSAIDDLCQSQNFTIVCEKIDKEYDRLFYRYYEPNVIDIPTQKDIMEGVIDNLDIYSERCVKLNILIDKLKLKQNELSQKQI